MHARSLALAATAVLLGGTAAGCAGTSGSQDPDAPPVRLVAYDGCDALLNGLRRATADQVGPSGLTGGGSPLDMPQDGMLRRGPQAAEGTPAPAQAAPEHSTTNAHERGADEPDSVKTDGRRIVTLARGRLQVIDPATRKVAHTLDIPGSRVGTGDLLLSGDRVLVVTRQAMAVPLQRPAVPESQGPGRTPVPPRPTTHLTLVDIAAAPKVVGTMTTDAAYMDARQTGSTARVVMQSRPRIDFPRRALPHGDDAKGAAEANRAAVLKAPLGAWLPSFQMDDGNGGAAKTYGVPCDQVRRPSAYDGSGMLSVLTFDLAQGLGDPQAISVAGDGSTVYGNGESLYVTGTPPRVFPMWRSGSAAPEERTDIYKFDVRGKGRPRYVASGSVKGHLLNQYSVSEHDGNLRLATTTGGTLPNRGKSQSTVYALAQRGKRLDEIGRVGGLGKGERIYSVRFIGTTAYVVTFRQVEHVERVDLSDPKRPRTTGELKITGYSAYLHPTADGKLIGVGKDADTSGRTRGLQVSLFDVSGGPRKLDSYRVPGASSSAEFDPHAFLYWPRSGLTVLPMRGSGGGGGEALVLKVTGTSVTKTGTVRHTGKRFADVTRSLIVGDTLWTFSQDAARATDAATLKGGTTLSFR